MWGLDLCFSFSPRPSVVFETAVRDHDSTMGGSRLPPLQSDGAKRRSAPVSTSLPSRWGRGSVPLRWTPLADLQEVDADQAEMHKPDSKPQPIGQRLTHPQLEPDRTHTPDEKAQALAIMKPVIMQLHKLRMNTPGKRKYGYNSNGWPTSHAEDVKRHFVDIALYIHRYINSREDVPGHELGALDLLLWDI